MLSYLEKFNDLDPELKEKVSGPKFMADMKKLEEKYDVKLATVVMKLMVRELAILDLVKYFVFEEKLEAKKAESLVDEMKETILSAVSDYLGFTLESPVSEKKQLMSWTERQKKANQVQTSDFFFSPEDEEEVRDLAKRLENFKKDKKEEQREKGNESIENDKKQEDITDQAIKEINLNFSSDELQKRFKHIIKTYVKKVRNKIDIKETLMKEVKAGGLDLNAELSGRIISIIDRVRESYEEKSEIEKPQKIKLPEDIEIRDKKEGKVSTDIFDTISLGARDIDYDFEALKLKQKDDQKSDIEKKSEGVNAKSALSGAKEPNDFDFFDDKKTEAVIEGKDSIPFDSFRLNINKKRTSASDKKREIEDSVVKIDGIKLSSPKKITDNSGKIKMDDVKFVPKLTGPLDELREMNLEDWRRLGSSPNEAADKILEKIYFLEKDSYEKRLQGIKAWRESPVNKMYLEIGKRGIIESKNISTVITEIINKQGDALNSEEFSAVMDLNKQLRF